MNSPATAMEQIGKYWGMWGARGSSSSSSTASPISAWAAAYSELSWEEKAFARDAAAHLGGCVWPPRSYSCTFCQREFRSAQALGGHMNVHRRDRALLRQGPSEDVHATTNDQPHPHPQKAALLYTTEAASNLGSTTTPATTAAGSAAAMGEGDGDANTTTTTTTTTTPPTSYLLSTIIKESKTNKPSFMPMPDHSVSSVAGMRLREDQAAIDNHHGDRPDDGDGVQSARKKRRRFDHPLASKATLLIFVQPTAKATATDVTASGSQGGADHETKVQQTTIPISPSSSSPLLDQRHELDLELRLGTTPKVTYMAIHKAS